MEPQENGTGDNTYPEPRQIYIYYKSLFPEEFANVTSVYVKPMVMLEVSSRSLMEPSATSKVKSLISDNFPDMDTTVVDSDIRTALTEKTFLEKAFLLHELFATDRCQTADRKSRHLYDLEKMMDKDFAVRAVHDDQLWRSINHHRQRYSSVRGIDYNVDIRKGIILTPPDSVMAAWEKDYNYMRTQMIYSGSALPFDQLIKRMRLLQDRFRSSL